MGYADRVPNKNVMSEHQWVPRGVPILGSTDDHLAAAVLARFGCARSRRRAGSGLRRPTVGLAAHHHGPDDAGQLVGQRHRRELLRLARQQFQEPRRGVAALGLLDDRGGAEYEQPSQILVALAADLAGPVFFRGGVLARRDADPRRKAPARAKSFGVRHLERKADAADRPDAGDRCQALAGLIVPMPSHQPRLDRLQLAIYRLELAGQQAEHLARQCRYALIAGQAPQQRGDLLGPPRFREGRLLAAVTPNSAAWPRIALISIVP